MRVRRRKTDIMRKQVFEFYYLLFADGSYGYRSSLWINHSDMIIAKFRVELKSIRITRDDHYSSVSKADISLKQYLNGIG